MNPFDLLINPYFFSWSLFTGENWIESRYIFSFITELLRWNIYGKTTSWMSLICTTVCLEEFMV